MEKLEVQLKKNGMLLKSVPNKEKTEKICKIAVTQNPHALKYVPAKLQTEELCRIALKIDPSVFSLISKSALTEKICLYAVKKDGLLIEHIDSKYHSLKLYRAAITNTLESLKYIRPLMRDLVIPKTNYELVKRCLLLLEKDLVYSIYLPRCLLQDRIVFHHLLKHNCIKVRSGYYNSETHEFCIEFTYKRLFLVKNSINPENYDYIIKIVFYSFDDFYHALDKCLENTVLTGYNFEGIDLYNYNVSGAVIDSSVLKKQGLYDDAIYKEIVLNRQFDSISPENGEFLLDLPDRELIPAPTNTFLRFDIDTIPIFYISDIHLSHRIAHAFKSVPTASRAEMYNYINKLVKKMVYSNGIIFSRSFLLIAGDTSEKFDFIQVFYKELVKYWAPGRIIVISGNHELLDPRITMEENILVYRSFFKKLGINYLHNELLCIDDDALNWQEKKHSPLHVLSEEQIIQYDASELRTQLKKYPLLILGGIGFSGLNKNYNSTNLRYGISFELLSHSEGRRKEIIESSRFSALHSKLMNCIPDYRVIVLSHMKKDDWTNDQYNPNWIYINGHNHRNFYEINENRTIYADNQIGYNNEAVRLKYFYTDSDYDIFSDKADGIYTISAQEYIDYNRAKRIYSNFSRTDASIYMLKSDGYYMFFYYGKFKSTSKYEKMYLLKGGSLSNLKLDEPSDLEYYYEKMGQYVQNIHLLLKRYSGAQEKISHFIKMEI